VAEELMNFAFEISLFVLPSDFLHAVKSYDMGPEALIPVRRKSWFGFFIALKNLSPRAGDEPAHLEPNGKHANHYTTKATDS
jgi:hypothetical protein